MRCLLHERVLVDGAHRFLDRECAIVLEAAFLWVGRTSVTKGVRIIRHVSFTIRCVKITLQIMDPVVKHVSLFESGRAVAIDHSSSMF